METKDMLTAFLILAVVALCVLVFLVALLRVDLRRERQAGEMERRREMRDWDENQ